MIGYLTGAIAGVAFFTAMSLSKNSEVYRKLTGAILILCFLTWMFGWWYLIAAAIYAGLLPDKLSPIDRFDLCATWPYNLGIYIRDYIHGKLE